MSLIFLGLAWLVLPLTEGTALVKDAACQASADALSSDSILNSPCESTETSTDCPAACATAIAAVDLACEGKNLETDGDSGNKTVVPFSEHRLTVIFLLETFATGDACKKYLFDEGYKSAVTCQTAHSFAAKELFFSPWCKTDVGGASEKSCDANCQKTIAVVKSQCKEGDSLGKDSDGKEERYNEGLQMMVLRLLGPPTCDYSCKTCTASSAIATRCAFTTLFAVAWVFQSTFF